MKDANTTIDKAKADVIEKPVEVTIDKAELEKLNEPLGDPSEARQFENGDTLGDLSDQLGMNIEREELSIDLVKDLSDVGQLEGAPSVDPRQTVGDQEDDLFFGAFDEVEKEVTQDVAKDVTQDNTGGHGYVVEANDDGVTGTPNTASDDNPLKDLAKPLADVIVTGGNGSNKQKALEAALNDIDGTSGAPATDAADTSSGGDGNSTFYNWFMGIEDSETKEVPSFGDVWDSWFSDDEETTETGSNPPASGTDPQGGGDPDNNGSNDNDNNNNNNNDDANDDDDNSNDDNNDDNDNSDDDNDDDNSGTDDEDVETEDDSTPPPEEDQTPESANPGPLTAEQKKAAEDKWEQEQKWDVDPGWDDPSGDNPDGGSDIDLMEGRPTVDPIEWVDGVRPKNPEDIDEGAIDPWAKLGELVQPTDDDADGVPSGPETGGIPDDPFGGGNPAADIIAGVPSRDDAVDIDASMMGDASGMAGARAYQIDTSAVADIAEIDAADTGPNDAAVDYWTT